MSGIYALYLSAFSFVVEIPRNLLSMLDLESLQPSTTINTLKGRTEYSSDDFRSNIIEEYLEVIDDNQKLIETKQKQWQNGYSAIWTCFRRFLAGVGLFLPIYVIQEPMAVLIANLLIVIYVISWLVRRISIDQFKSHIQFDWKVDLGWTFISIYTFLSVSNIIGSESTENTIFALIVFLCILLVTISSYQLDQSRSSVVLLRTLSISLFAFILYFVFALNEGNYQGIGDTSIITRATASVTVSGLFASLLMAVGLAVKISHQKAKIGKEFLKELVS